MASGQIRMTPETMRARAGEYSTQAGNLQQIIAKMDSLLNQLQQEWEGSSAESYAAKFNELRPGFTKAKDLIDEISAALKAAAQRIEDTDASIKF